MDSFDNLMNGDIKQHAQHFWSMLDDMANTNPQAYRKFIDKQLAEGKKYYSPPQPHMCVLTRPVGGKPKELFYLNICGWERVPAPQSEEAAIPVTGGPVYSGKNSDGEPCQLVTICFSPRVLEEFGFDSKLVEERRMLIQLALSYLADTRSLHLSSSCTLLKDERYMGDLALLQKHTLENGKAGEEDLSEQVSELEKTFGPMPEDCKDSLIHQLSSITVTDSGEGDRAGGKSEGIKLLGINTPTPSSSHLIEEVSSDRAELQTPQHEVIQTDTQQITIKVVLPGVTHMQDCMLDISEDELWLEVEGLYRLHVVLQKLVDPAQASAKFRRKTNTLIVSIPHRS